MLLIYVYNYNLVNVISNFFLKNQISLEKYKIIENIDEAINLESILIQINEKILSLLDFEFIDLNIKTKKIHLNNTLKTIIYLYKKINIIIDNFNINKFSINIINKIQETLFLFITKYNIKKNNNFDLELDVVNFFLYILLIIIIFF